ncbi:sensor histidine kinase [Pontibacter cellulosilyticus]|uniref:Histidine kinase n=1 Tax=Pontibacter cellulosilyticus TaxID=1720253 RepID=A0A923NCL1_9BACT|nr:histidine kinase [Pontibacter cellulosilyticus]MBC5994460.1 histidine kinase [Pontibacter cellulosilyticus]
MNDLTLKTYIAEPIHRNKVEFWAATTIFVFALFSLAIGVSPNRYLFREAGIEYNYYEHYFIPQLFRYLLLYLVFLFTNFVLIPKLLKKKLLWLNAFLTLITFVAVGLFVGILDTYTKGYLFARFESLDDTYDFIFQQSYHYAFWLLIMLAFYTAIKYSGLYLLSNSTSIESKYKIITRDVLTAFVAWMVSVFLLLILNIGEEITIIWGLVSLSALIIYCYSFYSLLPKALHKKNPFRYYAIISAIILIVAYLPVAFLMMLLFQDEDTAFGSSMFNVVFHMFITVPATWFLFKRHLKGNEELYVLKEELGKSTANVDFLRSQINPHFLFNALNTLYGTALQENSERTAQGIQMLGDMMRFMLHENLQQKILLSREIEYMQNFIELQTLRTSASPNISIETKIQEVVSDKFIAPMLLIPFVENAFKHGISLKHKSWIRVTLHIAGNKLYFDVYNSIHDKQELDPEKDKSGVGLINVKQRLEHLYPNRHELMIRETAEEYFVHLTLQL